MEMEPNKETFHQLMDQFMQYWLPREAEFMTLFKTNYASRVGIIFILYAVYHFIMNAVTETWARCYRRYSHGDTDTNMYLERSVN